MSERTRRAGSRWLTFGCCLVLGLLAAGVRISDLAPNRPLLAEDRVLLRLVPGPRGDGTRPWGPEQATGEPNTPDAGDYSTAWASETPDDQREWLVLQYAKAVVPQVVVIHESYNPGAVYKVGVFKDDGTEVEAWKGKDPTTPDKPRGISEIPLKIDFATKKVKVYIDSPQVAGWNEIDAVGLRDGNGQIQWAKTAQASSTFGQFAMAGAPDNKRAWGPEQAIGEPDTLGAGDIPTAWASRAPDDQPEWLQLEYEAPLEARAVVIHETYNPGAVSKVAAIDPEGQEVEAWAGADPTPRDSDQGVSIIPVKLPFKTQKIKIYIDSANVPGWNEIDAVGVRDADGQLHWAVKATASSTFAMPAPPPVAVVPPVRVVPSGKRNWGPEQAAGEPDTPDAGDYVTAWASASEDGQREWLVVHYRKPVVPEAVVIHESFNPGAVDKVSVFKEDGTEVEVWKGKDPTTPDKPNGVSEIPIKIDFAVKQIKIYLDSPNVAGWNEIDAVGLRDAQKKLHWGSRVEASSTYAAGPPFSEPEMPVRTGRTVVRSAAFLARIRELERQVERLKAENARIPALEAEIRDLKRQLEDR